MSRTWLSSQVHPSWVSRRLGGRGRSNRLDSLTVPIATRTLPDTAETAARWTLAFGLAAGAFELWAVALSPQQHAPVGLADRGA